MAVATDADDEADADEETAAGEEAEEDAADADDVAVVPELAARDEDVEPDAEEEDADAPPLVADEEVDADDVPDEELAGAWPDESPPSTVAGPPVLAALSPPDAPGHPHATAATNTSGHAVERGRPAAPA